MKRFTSACLLSFCRGKIDHIDKEYESTFWSCRQVHVAIYDVPLYSHTSQTGIVFNKFGGGGDDGKLKCISHTSYLRIWSINITLYYI